MTEEQRDDLIIALSQCSPTNVRKILAEYLQLQASSDNKFTFYEFLRKKFDIEGYWKETGLA